MVCKYDDGYGKQYKKYWCRGSSWNSCETVVKTTGSEAEVKNGRTSIKDNQTLSEFTVRLDNLIQQDAGIYWCAIERRGYDLECAVNIKVLPGEFHFHTLGETKHCITEEKSLEAFPLVALAMLLDSAVAVLMLLHPVELFALGLGCYRVTNYYLWGELYN